MLCRWHATPASSISTKRQHQLEARSTIKRSRRPLLLSQHGNADVNRRLRIVTVITFWSSKLSGKFVSLRQLRSCHCTKVLEASAHLHRAAVPQSRIAFRRVYRSNRCKKHSTRMVPSSASQQPVLRCTLCNHHQQAKGNNRHQRHHQTNTIRKCKRLALSRAPFHCQRLQGLSACPTKPQQRKRTQEVHNQRCAALATIVMLYSPRNFVTVPIRKTQ